VGTIVEVKIGGSPDQLKRLESGGDSKRLFDGFVNEMGETISSRMRRRITEMLLRTNSKYEVGATGEAAANIQIESSGSGSNRIWTITEGDRTKANFFIRRGFEGSTTGELPPENKIMQWVLAKGIRLYDPENRKLGYIRSRSRKGREYFRRRTSTMSPREKALLVLRKYISRTGSKYSHWRSLHPSGSPRFDYVALAMRHENMFQSLMNKMGRYAVEAYVTWVNGRGRDNPGRVFRNFE